MSRTAPRSETPLSEKVPGFERALLLCAMHALLLISLARPATAQESSSAAPAQPETQASQPARTAPSTELNVSRLPINLGRLQRRLRASAERIEGDGTNLKVFVDVYAFAPPLVLFRREDLLSTAPVPGAPPTASDIIDLNTPTEHRGSNTVRKGGINILGGRKK
jgi:hypothetical protein